MFVCLFSSLTHALVDCSFVAEQTAVSQGGLIVGRALFLSYYSGPLSQGASLLLKHWREAG